MFLERFTAHELYVIRQVLSATFQYFDWDFRTRLGVDKSEMRELLDGWAKVDNPCDEEVTRTAVINSLNDLLHGVGIGDEEFRALAGVGRSDVLRIFGKAVEEPDGDETL